MTTDQQNKQLSFSQAEYVSKKKLTRRDVFLAKMESVVPWARLIAVIEPYYPKSGKRGRPPIGLKRMLRMYFVQQWYGLADVAIEDALYDSQALRNFCGINLAVPSVSWRGKKRRSQYEGNHPGSLDVAAPVAASQHTACSTIRTLVECSSMVGRTWFAAARHAARIRAPHRYCSVSTHS